MYGLDALTVADFYYNFVQTALTYERTEQLRKEGRLVDYTIRDVPEWLMDAIMELGNRLLLVQQSCVACGWLFLYQRITMTRKVARF